MAKEKDEAATEMATFSAKAMLLENAEKGTKIKYNDRQKVEIVKATKHYKVGKIITPHKVKAEALIKAGIAKEVKK